MDFDLIIKDLKESTVKTNKYVGIGEGTIKTYIAKIRYLAKQEVLNEKLNDFINSYYTVLNSKAAYQIAVMGVAKHSPTFLEIIGKDTIEVITKENEKVMEEIRGNPRQDKTEKQEENWMDLKQLKKIAKEQKDNFSIQDQLLIAMYTLMPPARLDYHDITIVRSPFINTETGRPEGIAEKQNFIRIYKQSGRTYTDLVLHTYKTDRTYGTFNERLPKPITDLILQLPVSQTHLFQKKGHGPFSSPETFAVYLRTVFKKLTGKNMSVDLLRSIYTTDFRKGEKSETKKRELARKMMNSVDVQTGYFKVE
jgi:hypothetical protein